MFSINNQILADHGFFINLDSSLDRLQNANNQIKNFNISGLERFSAIRDTLHQSSATKSHCAALSLSLERGYDCVFIAEDDFQILPNVSVGGGFTESLYSYLPEFTGHISEYNWDVLLLGFNGKKKCIPVSKHLSKNFKSTGAWGYLIKKKAIEFILNNFSYYRDRQAIDDILPSLTYYGFNSLVANIQIVHHAHGLVSTLQPSLGPIDYREWINGNYYNCIWFYIKNASSFDNALDEIYLNSEFNRNNIISIKNYDGQIEKILNFISSHPEYEGSYMEIDASQDSALRYNMSVEWSHLLHSIQNTPNITGLGTNTIVHYI